MKNAMRSATPHYTWIQGCYWMVYCILLSFSSVYLLEQGLSNTEIGLLLGLSGLASALLQPVAGARAGRMRRLSLGQLSGCLVGGGASGCKGGCLWSCWPCCRCWPPSSTPLAWAAPPRTSL